MSELVWASDTLRTVIAPPGSAAGKMERIGLAAKKLRWSFTRAKDVWYADERVAIKPREMRKIEEISGVKYGQAEVAEVDQIIARADALLESQDADFYRPHVAALRAFFRAVAGSRTEG